MNPLRQTSTTVDVFRSRLHRRPLHFLLMLACGCGSVALAPSVAVRALATELAAASPQTPSGRGDQSKRTAEVPSPTSGSEKSAPDASPATSGPGDLAVRLEQAVPAPVVVPDWGGSDVSGRIDRLARRQAALQASSVREEVTSITPLPSPLSCCDVYNGCAPSLAPDRDRYPVPEDSENATVPLPNVPTDALTDQPPPIPNLQRQLASADVGGLRESLSRVPFLIGDGCAPGGTGSRSVVDRLVVVAQPSTFAAGQLTSSNSATLYRFPTSYENINTITQPIVPGAQPLSTVAGTPTIGFTGASNTGGALSFMGNPAQVATGAAFQSTADSYFQANIPVPADKVGTTEFASAASGALEAPVGTYSAFAYYDFVVDTASLTPGYNVGFVKLTENVSPLPRDRVYMNYSYFNDAFFSPQLRADVNRFMPGFEKTFFDGWTSIEIRTPFAATLDATQTQDLNSPSGITGDRNVEFGNLSVIFKSVIEYGDTWALTGGVQVMCPTASNVTIQSERVPGQDEIFIQNQSTHVMPFFGFIWAPNDRFFTQSLIQVDVDTNGNPVWANVLQQQEIVAAENFAGRLNYPTFLYVAIGGGYWIYQDNSPGARLTGIAPLAEVHVNQALDQSDVICFGNYQLGNELGVTSLVNGLVGLNFEWGQRSTLTFAYATPIGGGSDRWFDGELRAMFNWRFGPQTRLTRVQF